MPEQFVCTIIRTNRSAAGENYKEDLLVDHLNIMTILYSMYKNKVYI